MGKVNFSDDFKRDAIRQIAERGYPVAEVSLRLASWGNPARACQNLIFPAYPVLT